MNNASEHTLTARLADYGIDYVDAMDRLSHNESLYRRCAKTFLETPYLERLEAALASNDPKEVESAAHTLKDASGNMSIPMLYDVATRICEQARSEDIGSAASLLPSAREAYENAVRGLRTLL